MDQLSKLNVQRIYVAHSDWQFLLPTGHFSFEDSNLVGTYDVFLGIVSLSKKRSLDSDLCGDLWIWQSVKSVLVLLLLQTCEIAPHESDGRLSINWPNRRQDGTPPLLVKNACCKGTSSWDFGDQMTKIRLRSVNIWENS